MALSRISSLCSQLSSRLQVNVLRYKMAPVVIAPPSQIATLPHIRELYDPNFLDLLLPAQEQAPHVKKPQPVPILGPTNPMIGALKTAVHQTWTQNLAPAYSSTGSPTLDAFQLLKHKGYTAETKNEFTKCLDDAWNEDPHLTLRIIWNIRSIHDGRADKETFYRAFGWLYDNHPRTAISNLRMLVDPVCPILHKDKQGRGFAHGYWKDLLNILALATLDQLGHTRPQFLHTHLPRTRHRRSRYSRFRGHKKKKPNPEKAAANIQASLQRGEKDKLAAKTRRAKEGVERHHRLVKKLEEEPKYRALYIAVTRLFAEGLARDLRIAEEISALPGDDAKDRRVRLLRQLSLAGKWAPTPQGAHDRHTNIATAIGMLLRRLNLPSTFTFPAALNDPSINPSSFSSDAGLVHILRSFYQRWVLTPLRALTCVPEPLMASGRWAEIKYGRVSSVCMKNNSEAFYKHDPTGFEAYLVGVEQGKKTISGAVLFPHELVGEAVMLAEDAAFEVREGGRKEAYKAVKEMRKVMAETRMRVVEQQWKALVKRLEESGKMENALAVCDVSGSMGSLGCGSKSGMRNDPDPIYPAISLSLVLAHLAKPPFNAGFITFSSKPRFVPLDLTKPLAETVKGMVDTEWEMNTDFNAVFVRLLLPLAVKHQVKPEDMIKRLFVFSDMQFDAARDVDKTTDWETNYDVIEKAYREAGYEVPQIVYWDLGKHGTVEVKAERKGVALMNGFSPAMLKVFMGEGEEGWEDLGESSGGREDRFDPLSVMKKAVMKKSFDGLVVVD